MFDNADVATLLEDAVVVLDERGWCQGKQMDSEGRVCAIGALNLAAHGNPMPYNAFEFAPGKSDILAVAVESLRTAAGKCIVNFNDDPGRTADSVKDAFIATAKKLRNL